MKLLYFSLASLTLFLLLMFSSISIATTRAEATAHDLKSASAQWRIEVLDQDLQFSDADESELKRDVLEFFNQAGSPTYSRIDHYTDCLCIVFIFSALGYFRERYVETKGKRTTR